MYKATLTHYAVPIQGDGFVENPGNLTPAISAVRAIYNALNSRAVDYDILIEGVSSNNLDDLLFSVNASTVLSGSQTGSGEIEKSPYKFEAEYSLAPKVDLPSLYFVLDSLVENQVTQDRFHAGNPELVDANLQIGKSENDGTWILRIFSKAVKYEIQITDSPDYFARSVTVDIEVDQLEMDDEDRRAILEVATVLADGDFRKDGRYDTYCRAKGNKPLSRFEVFELSGLDRTGSDVGVGLHSILENDHYSAAEFLALSEDNLEAVVPKYLVLADKLRLGNTKLRSQLALDLSRHRFQVAQLDLENPKLGSVLDVKPELVEGIEEAVGSYLVGHAAQVHPAGQKSDTHRTIRSQLAEYESRMRSHLDDVQASTNFLERMEGAGIVRSQGFDKLRFFSRASRSGINELALEIVPFLESLEERI